MNQVRHALNRQAAVALIGPRQAGKTTLALEISKKQEALYLDLEDFDDRNQLASPKLFFERNQDKLIILDEIHRTPALFETLRGVIDKKRRNSVNSSGQFLILGSASIDLLKQSGESLAGRVAYIDLLPLAATEIENSLTSRDSLWLRGGFLDSYLAANDAISLAIRKDFIRTYLERDVHMFGPRIPAETLNRLWTMLAHRQGAPLIAAELARSLETSAQSVTRYIDLLCDLLLVRRLTPYFKNIGKRLVKSPKVYIRDSGLTHALLGIETLNQLTTHPVYGASWEGFVIENLLSELPWGTRAFYYRTATGTEVDLVLEHSDGSLWAIEIKRTASAKMTRGLKQALEDLSPQQTFIVHASNERYPISENIEAIGLYDMMQELIKKS